MDSNMAKELSKLANHQIKLAKEYVDARQKAGDAKSDLEILLTSKLAGIREIKPNVGYEMAMLMLMEDSLEARELHRELAKNQAKYKGLEKLIEAHQSKISLEQSIMKYIGQGEKYGG